MADARVVGRFVRRVGDSDQAMAGYVRLRPDVPVRRDRSVPATVAVKPVICQLDAEGNLTTDVGLYASVQATDSADFVPEGGVWWAEFHLDAPVPSFPFEAPTYNPADPSTIVDLTLVAPVLAAPPEYITKGETGDEGPDGPQGDKGDKGDTGDTGPATTLAVGTVSKLDPGSTPSVTITGEAPSQTLNFGLVAGDKGDKGDKGDVGPIGMTWRGAWDAGTDYAQDDAVAYQGSSYFATHDPELGDLPTSDSGAWQAFAVQGSQGDKGDPGPANSLGIGTVTKLAPGSTPTATISGSSPSQTVSFGLVTGDTGSQGTPGELLPLQTSINASGNLDLSAYGATPVRLYVTLTGNVTITALPTAPAAGKSSTVDLVFIQTGTNAFTVTWSQVDVRWPYATSTAPSGVAHVMSAGQSATAPAAVFDEVFLTHDNGQAFVTGVVSRQQVKWS